MISLGIRLWLGWEWDSDQLGNEAVIGLGMRQWSAWEWGCDRVGNETGVTHLSEANAVIVVLVDGLYHLLESKVRLWLSQLLHHQLQLHKVDKMVPVNIIPEFVKVCVARYIHNLHCLATVALAKFFIMSQTFRLPYSSLGHLPLMKTTVVETFGS